MEQPTADEISTLADRLSLLAKEVASDSDPQAKNLRAKALIQEAKKVIWQLQDPVDAIIEHTVNIYTIGALKSLLALGVFEAIPPAGSATVKEIAQKCDADEELITRLMRQPVCVNIFEEVKVNEWSHNKFSIGLSTHFTAMGRGLFTVSQDEMGPAIHDFDKYMQKHGKKDVHTYKDTPHSWYFDMEGKDFWEVLSSDPTRLDTFNRTLAAFAASFPVVAIFPYEEKLKEGNSSSRPFVVDIGGGRGPALIQFKEKCPSLQGERILQDRKAVLDSISEEELPGVTKMAHDFFAEQPVKNAQVYYIRRVLHDWQDEEAAKILGSIKPAMGADSRIIVSDMTLPEPITTNDVTAVWLDLMMMTIGGKERTSRDWEKLAELSGLRLVRVWQEPEKFGPLAMVEYMLPEGSATSNGP